MQLEINEKVIRIATVALLSRVDAFNAPDLRSRLDKMFAEGTTHFVIDLSRTPFLDSAGMAALVSILKRARQEGGDVKLVWPQIPAARRIIELTRLDRVFDMAETVEEATAAFKNDQG